jgi:hypothetical protein
VTVTPAQSFFVAFAPHKSSLARRRRRPRHYAHDDGRRLSSTEKYGQIFFYLRAPFFLFFALLGRATTQVNAHGVFE